MKKAEVCKVFLLNFPRPVGIEPTIYLEAPILGDGIIEVEDYGLRYLAQDPFHPELIECSTLKEAIIRILDFNDTDEYLKHLKVKNKE